MGLKEDKELYYKTKADSIRYARGCGCLLIILFTLLLVWAFSPSKSSISNQPDSQEETPAKTQSTAREYDLSDSFSINGQYYYSPGYVSYDWKVKKIALRKLSSFNPGTKYDSKTRTPKNGKFYIFEVSAINQGAKEEYLGTTALQGIQLVGIDGKVYSENADNDFTATYSVYYARDVKIDGTAYKANPGAVATEWLYFDVPEQKYRLCDEKQESFCVIGIE